MNDIFIIIFTYCGLENADWFHVYDDWSAIRAPDLQHALEKFWSEQNVFNSRPRRENKNLYRITKVISNLSEEDYDKFANDYFANEPPHLNAEDYECHSPIEEASILCT